MLRDTMRLNRAGKSHDMAVMRSLPPIISFGPKQPSKYLLSLIAGSDASIGELCEAGFANTSVHVQTLQRPYKGRITLSN